MDTNYLSEEFCQDGGGEGWVLPAAIFEELYGLLTTVGLFDDFLDVPAKSS